MGETWKIEDELVKEFNIQRRSLENILNLMDNGHSIPFIVRYRKDKIGDVASDTLFKIEKKTAEYKQVISKVKSKLSSIKNQTVKKALNNCKSIIDYEFIMEPFKEQQRSSASLARKLGLQEIADGILMGYIKNEVELPPQARKKYGNAWFDKGVGCLIKDSFRKDMSISNEFKSELIDKRVIITTKVISTDKAKPTEEFYYKLDRSLSSLQHHHIMKLNRLESAKVIKVELKFYDSLHKKMEVYYKQQIEQRYLCKISHVYYHKVKTLSFDVFKKQIIPMLLKRIRKQRTNDATECCLDVFQENLRHLVMCRPLFGVPILGLDPGYTNGTKAVVIDKNGDVQHTVIFYINSGNFRHIKYGESMNNLKKIMEKYEIMYIAIGNGIGSRETIDFIKDFIQINSTNEKFRNIKFSITREEGSSKYSVSKNGREDYGNLSELFISAASIAKRLRDPLSEYLRMDPKAIGVGMFQHDLLDKMLKERFDFVVNECICLVGLDLNNAPGHILSRISGISSKVAERIVEYRNTNGPFINRNQLNKVRGIGGITFTQMAGFLRIKPTQMPSSMLEYTSDGDAIMHDAENIQIHPDANLLDQTAVHPESYPLANEILTKLNCVPADIGTVKIQNAVQRVLEPNIFMQLHQSLSNMNNVGEMTVRDILEYLSRNLHFDERFNFRTSMIMNTLRDNNNVNLSQVFDGIVSNVTTFAVFVDIGLNDTTAYCLLHPSAYVGAAVQVRFTQLKPLQGTIECLL